MLDKSKTPHEQIIEILERRAEAGNLSPAEIEFLEDMKNESPIARGCHPDRSFDPLK